MITRRGFFLLVAAVASTFISISTDAAPKATVSVAALRIEYATNPLGIDVREPRFSWQLRSQRRGVLQTGYQVRVSLEERGLRSVGESIWDSGKVTSGESTQIVYAGPSLESRKRYRWQVRIWDGRGMASDWSSPTWWEMGLLEPTDWTAQWIASPAQSQVVPALRREFALRKKARSARIYVTARGLYQLFLNGHRIGDSELTPGFTSYNKRLQYQTYDVTSTLSNGQNAIAAWLGDGWYRGRLGFWQDNIRTDRYGSRTALLLQLEINYEDGTSEHLVSDGSWRSHVSPILSSSLYDGESYDARLEETGWNRPGFDDSEWSPVDLISGSAADLIAQSAPPVRKLEERVPRRIFRAPNGQTLVDMGQNMVGWIRLTVHGPAGTAVTLTHAEELDADGNLYRANIRGAQQTVRYTLKGQGVETYEPHFTFQGFRYVAVDGLPGSAKPENFTGIVVSSDNPRHGEFLTSDSLVNRLQENIVWSQKGNFVDIPTDCPQRDERLGWAGDAYIFAPTAAYNADVAGFFTKWLKDLAADQYRDGNVPWVVPDVFRASDEDPQKVFVRQIPAGAAGWGDAAVGLPWILYTSYGDRRILQEQYPSMVRWLRFQQGRARPDLVWDGDPQFADHADVGFQRVGGTTDTALVATAFFARSAHILSRVAQILDRHEDARDFAALFDEIRRAFQTKFVADDGSIGGDTQAAYVLALQFDLLTEQQRAAAFRHLVEDLRKKGHLTTGILASGSLLFVLSEGGYLDEAYRLLMRRDAPSWLYPVTRGATTIWERWDGIKPDGSFQIPAMNSFNQYAFGAVGDWMYRTIAGINLDPERPGYKHIVIKPRPGGGLTHAKGSYETPYGQVSSAWRIAQGLLELSVTIPPNTTATVTLPSAHASEVRESGKVLGASPGILRMNDSGSDTTIDIGSGVYIFSYPMR